MANGQVNLTISDRRVGNGLGALASDADKATAAFGMSRQSVSDFAKGLGKLAPGLRNIGGVLNNLALGPFRLVMRGTIRAVWQNFGRSMAPRKGKPRLRETPKTRFQSMFMGVWRLFITF